MQQMQAWRVEDGKADIHVCTYICTGGLRLQGTSINDDRTEYFPDGVGGKSTGPRFATESLCAVAVLLPKIEELLGCFHIALLIRETTNNVIVDASVVLCYYLGR